MKSKKIILTVITLSIIIISVYFIVTKKDNLVKLNYQEIIEKIENKESFVLCITAKKCVHCNEYKPKLKKISNDYDIIIYYTDINNFKDNEYEEFKVKFSFDGSTPTTIFFKDGEEKTTATRIEGNEKFEKIINKLKTNGFINE